MSLSLYVAQIYHVVIPKMNAISEHDINIYIPP